MPKDTYRYYCIDGTELLGADQFQAETDEEAVAQVRAKHPNAKWELWQERRLVVKSNPYAASNAIDSSLRTIAEARQTLRNTASLVERPVRLGREGDAR